MDPMIHQKWWNMAHFVDDVRIKDVVFHGLVVIIPHFVYINHESMINSLSIVTGIVIIIRY